MKRIHSQGAALAVSLIMLTAVTILAIVSLQRSSLQIKMVGNSQIIQNYFYIAYSEVEEKYDTVKNSTENSKILNRVMLNVRSDEDGLVMDAHGDLQFNPTPMPIIVDYGLKQSTITTTITYQNNDLFNHKMSGRNSKGTFENIEFLGNSEAVHNTGRFGSSQELKFAYKKNKG